MRDRRANSDTERLRLAAEERVARRFADIVDETQGKIEHELRVYQVELEMQNQQLRETQIERQQAQELYSMLYHQSPVGYVSIDQTGLILELNESFATMLGLTIGRVRNTHLVRYLSPDSAAIVRQRLPAFYKNPDNKTLELTVLRPDAEPLYVEIQGRRLKDLPLLTCNVIDRTIRRRTEENLKVERDRLEQERQSLQLIFNAAQAGMLLINENGLVTQVNRQATRLVGKDVGDFVNRGPGDGLCCIHTLSPVEGCGHAQLCRDCTIRKSFEYVLGTGGSITDTEVEKTLVINGSHRRYFLSLSAVRLVLAGSAYVLLSITDMTERKQAELDLQKKNEELEQFVYIVSHDLKSPIITVTTFLDLLRKDLAATDQESVVRDIGFIEGAAAKMSQLLDALVQYSRVGRADEVARTEDFSAVVKTCLEVLAGPIQQSQIQVEVADVSLQLTGDLMQLEQLWQNLIENAIKYMGDQRQPKIEIGAETQGAETVFFVRDNGMGVAPEDCERIFTLFSQLDSKSGGSGLGLALVKKIVGLYQGRIRVESAGAGQGSCFYFTLPTALIPHTLNSNLSRTVMKKPECS